jgi:hypothetical protein
MSQRRKKDVDLELMVTSSSASAYEALELFKFRINRAKSKGDIDLAIQTSCHGAILMLNNAYVNAGSELCRLYASLLSESAIPMSDSVRADILRIDAAFKEPGCPARRDFLSLCIDWSVIVTNQKFGDAEIQTQIGDGTCVRKM